MKVNSLGLSTYQALEGKKAKPKDFFEVLLDKVKEVDAKEKEAERAILDLLSGKKVDLVELSMKISQADVSMKLLLRIRNKVLEAYQEIMRMQI
ncbi:MAG: flagellar hook-basal body complex protein FliE [Thermodesulfobacteriaceae bacterium]|jgi:flagellar hook-basal body complex protein FliE